MPINKAIYLGIYTAAYSNALSLVKEADLLLKNGYYPRAYFLAFTALEEISKSQMAADVYTGYSTEVDYRIFYKDHPKKLARVVWVHNEQTILFNNLRWIGPEMNDFITVNAEAPLWNNRQKSLYVDNNENSVLTPETEINREQAQGMIHLVEKAIERIVVVTEIDGNQIGTKGFMK